MKRFKVQVRLYESGKNHHLTDKFTAVENITRTLWAEEIGNFNPLFCRYKGKRTLVHSDQGDLSDPFRREQSYENSLFIKV